MIYRIDDPAERAMGLVRRYKHLAAFLSAMLLEFWFSMCAYAVNHDNYALAITANLTYPFITLLPMILIVEQAGFVGKIKIAMFEGFGFAVGTVVFLSVLKPRVA